MITTSAPSRSLGDSATGTPRNVGMSSASRGKILFFTRVDVTILDHSGYSLI